MSGLSSRLAGLGFNESDLKKFLNDLKLISLPPKKKKEIVIRALRKMKKIAVSNTSNQREPDGTAWKPRKKGDKKMLRKIAGKLNTQNETDKGKLYYKLNQTSRIAAEHQYGLPVNFKFKTNENSQTQKNYDSPCTPAQAKKLRDLGYKIYVGKRKKKLRPASIGEIRSTITMGQASRIIRNMSNNAPSRGLRNWIIPTVKRPFLDEREQENAKVITEIINQFMKENS